LVELLPDEEDCEGFDWLFVPFDFAGAAGLGAGLGAPLVSLAVGLGVPDFCAGLKTRDEALAVEVFFFGAVFIDGDEAFGGAFTTDIVAGTSSIEMSESESCTYSADLYLPCVAASFAAFFGAFGFTAAFFSTLIGLFGPRIFFCSLVSVVAFGLGDLGAERADPSPPFRERSSSDLDSSTRMVGV
jgi:hypothetical protein